MTTLYPTLKPIQSNSFDVKQFGAYLGPRPTYIKSQPSPLPIDFGPRNKNLIKAENQIAYEFILKNSREVFENAGIDDNINLHPGNSKMGNLTQKPSIFDFNQIVEDTHSLFQHLK